MYVYVARTKKEFERVCYMLDTLNIKWTNKCGWNIEISLPIWETH